VLIVFVLLCEKQIAFTTFDYRIRLYKMTTYITELDCVDLGYKELCKGKLTNA
jgi:hypothetical protein